MGNWTLRIIDRGVDPHVMGRWSFVTLRGTNNTKVIFVTAYRVCDDRQAGPKMAYKQQVRALNKSSGNDKEVSDPHRQCVLDFQAWIETLTRQNSLIILSMDANEDLQD
jgi:hypothetical protein